MHVTVPRNDLLRLLEAIVGSSEPKGSMPTLAHVLLTTLPASSVPAVLRATCTTLHQTTSGNVGGDVTEPGSVSVDVKALIERVKVMPVGPVSILATEGGQVTVKAEGAPRRFVMHGIPSAEFPNQPQPPPDAAWIELDAAVLARLLDGTSYAQAKDPTRPHVHATLIEWDGRVLRAVATDGHRLAKAEATAPAAAKLSMLVSANAIEQIRKLARAETEKGEKAGKVRLTTAAPHLFLEVGGLSFSARLVDAQFPPYQQVVEGAVAGATNVLRADRDKLVEVLKATQLASDNGIVALKVLADLAGGTLRVGNVGGDQATRGEAADELGVGYQGSGVRLGLSAAYVIEALHALPEGEAVVRLGGELDPIVVEPATPLAGESLLVVVMPAKIDPEITASVAAKAKG